MVTTGWLHTQEIVLNKEGIKEFVVNRSVSPFLANISVLWYNLTKSGLEPGRSAIVYLILNRVFNIVVTVTSAFEEYICSAGLHTDVIHPPVAKQEVEFMVYCKWLGLNEEVL